MVFFKMIDMDQQMSLFKVRDLRKKDQFKIDDAYLNGYARICGKDASLVYMSLCRHAEFNSQKAFPSQEKIAWELGVSDRTVRRGIKKLVERNIILTERERRNGKFSNYLYILLDKSEWKQTTGQNRPMVKPADKNHQLKTTGGSVPTKDNKEQRIINIKDNKDNIAIQRIAERKDQDVFDLINLFKPINPSYERLFRNKTQRTAIERLIKKFGKDKVEKIIKYLVEIFGSPFAPRITTPYALEQKLGDLIAYIKQKSEEKINFVDLKK